MVLFKKKNKQTSVLDFNEQKLGTAHSPASVPPTGLLGEVEKGVEWAGRDTDLRALASHSYLAAPPPTCDRLSVEVWRERGA